MGARKDSEFKIKKSSKWKCYQCEKEKVIKTKNIIYLQLGDRMAGGVFTYCTSDFCRGVLRRQVPVSKAAREIEQGGVLAMELNGTTSTYPRWKGKKNEN